jgi:hypothetical protein
MKLFNAGFFSVIVATLVQCAVGAIAAITTSPEAFNRHF